MISKPRIVVIGGGTGSFTLLSELKNATPYITALVNMADDGGSTGILRDELGVLPPGDVRQCLVALSDAPQELRDLFTFRFGEGTFSGHSFGNIFLSAVQKMTDNFEDAVRMASDVLRITGRVLPITLDDCQLVYEGSRGAVVGQYKIETTNFPPGERPQLRLSPAGHITPDARRAIMAADIVVIAPGNLYASLLPALLVQGVADALATTTAQVAFVCNLVNKPNHTADFAVHDYTDELERFIGEGTLDYVFYNTDLPSATLLKKYALEGEYPVRVDTTAFDSRHYQTVGGRFLSHAKHTRNKNDTLIKRSLIRHDAQAVTKALLSL